jgi:hypothetical protein
MSRMPRLGQVKPTIFPLIAGVSGNSFSAHALSLREHQLPWELKNAA